MFDGGWTGTGRGGGASSWAASALEPAFTSLDSLSPASDFGAGGGSDDELAIARQN